MEDLNDLNVCHDETFQPLRRTLLDTLLHSLEMCGGKQSLVTLKYVSKKCLSVLQCHLSRSAHTNLTTDQSLPNSLQHRTRPCKTR
jgi:hypothetical protein